MKTFYCSTLWVELIKQSRRMLVSANDLENEFYIEKRGGDLRGLPVD